MAAQADAVFVYRDDAAVAQDGKLLAEAELRDANLIHKVGPGGAVERLCERVEDGIVVLGVAAELGDGLGDQHVEPVEAFRLVAVDVVVRLAQDGSNSQRRGAPEDGGLFPVE